MFPLLQHMSVDLPVLAFTLGLSIVTGLLFGLVPAWKSSHADLNTTLKEAGGPVGKRRRIASHPQFPAGGPRWRWRCCSR